VGLHSDPDSPPLETPPDPPEPPQPPVPPDPPGPPQPPVPPSSDTEIPTPAVGVDPPQPETTQPQSATTAVPDPKNKLKAYLDHLIIVISDFFRGGKHGGDA
jgi:hypothetical protein